MAHSLKAEKRYGAIRERLRRACEAADRDPSEITLIAVSKTHPVEAIQELYDLGQRHFGENKLQEAQPKIEALPADITWHYVGKLQSKKTRKVAELFSVIHTLESESQLRELQKTSSEIDGLVEVNVANEPQKSGVSPEELPGFIESVLQCPQVRLRGLMTIGPANPNAEALRPFFRTMRRLLQRSSGNWLSMGMSNDFEVAIQEGATHIRVGTALFGERQ